MTHMQLSKEEYNSYPTVISPIELQEETTLSEFEGLQKLVMLDRYSVRDNTLTTLKEGDLVVVEVKPDPDYPTQGFGTVKSVEGSHVIINVTFPESMDGDDGKPMDLANFKSHKSKVVKPLETYWEQIAHRVSKGVASVEKTPTLQRKWYSKFFWMLKNQLAVPAGRILYGAGSGTDVTLFNCFQGDTIVQTKEGAKLIKDLRGEVEVLSQEGVYRKAIFDSYGEQELYEVLLSNGETIKTTAGHEWVVIGKGGSSDKVTTLELEGRSIPIVSNNTKERSRDEEEVTKGIRHGIFYGDGSITEGKYGYVLLYGEKRELANYFETGDYTITPHYNNEYLGVYGIDIAHKELPSEDESADYWYGFILGLIATDGCVDTRGSVMCHSSKLEDLQKIVKNLYKTGLGYSSIKMTRKLSPFNGEYSPVYKLQFVKQTFKSEDLLKPSHKDKYDNSLYTPVKRRPVIKVEKVNPLNTVEEVFCCNEPETHTFVIGTGYLTGNCFVLDYIEDSRKGISRHRETTMEIMSRGGGVGSNGSALRPKDAVVTGVNGKSSGSVSWLGDLANLTDLVQQGGSRRGAQMIGLGDWHPDIITFILSKIQNPFILDKITKEVNADLIVKTVEELLIRDGEGKPIAVRSQDFMTGANISVLVSHDFMEAVEEDQDWVLRFPDLENLTQEQKEFYDTDWKKLGDVRKWEELGYPTKEYYRLPANELWELINIAARYSAEPGVIFIDHCNDMSNSYYYAPLVVTNPCGEQPLPADAVCNLIAINLAKMFDEQTQTINYELLKEVTHVSQRFSDNVIDHSFYFLPDNEKMAKGERRIGKGVMGLADLMIDLKLPYGGEAMLEVTNGLFNFIKEESYLASADLAEERGSFPYYEEDSFLQSGFVKTLSLRVTKAIKEKGIRNVCSLTVAPTGSTGTMVGVSTGLEPYFGFTYFRSGRLGKFIEVNTAIAQRYFDANPDATELPDYYVASKDISALGHAKVQSVIQKHVDSAISKTCNAPRGFTVEDNKELYIAAWKGGCKGVTVYVDGSRDSQVLSTEAVDNEFTEEGQEEQIQQEPEKDLVFSKAVQQESVKYSEDMLLDDTRVCAITFDEQGNMIKEC